MRIRGNGFSINTDNKLLNAEEIIRSFILHNKNIIERKDYTRRIILKEESDFFIGLVLTFKKQRKNCFSKIEGNRFIIKVQDLQGDEKIVNFNFFCIKKDSLKGLYLYYRGSCSLNSLFSRWQTQSNNFIKKIIKTEKELLGPRATRKQREAIDKRYTCRINYKIIVDSKDVKNMLNEFKSIKSAGFRFESLDFVEHEMKSLEELTRNTEVRFNISDDDKTKVIPIAERISELLYNFSNIGWGRVEAVDHAGNDRLVDLINCPSYFIDYDFDELAEHVNGLTEDNFSQNAIVKMIKEEILKGGKSYEFN